MRQNNSKTSFFLQFKSLLFRCNAEMTRINIFRFKNHKIKTYELIKARIQYRGEPGYEKFSKIYTTSGTKDITIDTQKDIVIVPTSISQEGEKLLDDLMNQEIVLP